MDIVRQAKDIIIGHSITGFYLSVDLKTVEKLNKFRQKRNIADYERIGMASKQEVNEMLDLAKSCG